MEHSIKKWVSLLIAGGRIWAGMALVALVLALGVAHAQTPPSTVAFTQPSQSPQETDPDQADVKTPPRLSSKGTPEYTPAAESSPRAFVIRRVSGPPTREAEFISSAWLAQAVRLDGFTQSNPKEGEPGTEQTIVYIGYDAKNLYVVFYCYDSDPEQIRANYSPRDDIDGDDTVGIVLDTFNDGRRAYKFQTNPLGVQADLLFTEDSGDDLAFDTVFKTDARVTSFGYLATMEIPFRSIRFAKNFPQTWGINFVRRIKRKDEEQFWSPVYRDRRGFLNQAGKMMGLENIARGHGYELIPYVFAARTTQLNDETAPTGMIKQSILKAGVDLKYSITPSLTASVTINPDFNDLEADQPRIRFNRRFRDSAETFVPEKRPFFLERADLFDTPLSLFFTRKIIDPKFGAKFTGKVGRYNIGFLSTSDAAPELSFDEDRPLFRSRNRNAVVNALRVSRDLYEQSSVGFIMLDRQFQGAFDRLYGVDANFRFLEKYDFTMQHVRSATRGQADEENRPRERTNGAGTMLAIARSDRHLSLDGYYINLTPDFRADLGFIERVDVSQFGGDIRYDFRPEGDTLISWGPKFSYGRIYDHEGNLNDVKADLSLNFTLAGNTALGLRAAHRMERFANINFIKQPVSFFASTERSQVVSGGFSYSFGPEINYNENDAFLGRGRELSLDVTVRPNEHFKIENVYLASRLNKDFVGQPRGFDTHIFQTRLNYQFNRELSLRLIPEYEFLHTHNLLSDDGLRRVSERTRTLRGSFLLSYVLKPGTVLYAGYNAGFDDVLFRSVRRFRPTDRGFFIKLSYLYR